MDVKAFLLRADEAAGDTFPRTPSFGWAPVPGALKYEFELATSALFKETSIVWTGETDKTPAVAIPTALPWMTGNPYALWGHVRVVTKTGTSTWSEPYGFNIPAPPPPAQLPDYPGLVRWSPVEGATSYQVWFQEPSKVISSVVNSADEREYYTFHQLEPWPSKVTWRVRALRTLYGAMPNGLPAVEYGPWSKAYTSINPPFQVGSLTLGQTVSDTVTDPVDPRPHDQTPAFLYTGSQSFLGTTSGLYRVYVFTDDDCINRVFVGAITGAPAYSPRTSGPLALPSDPKAAATIYLPDGSEGSTQMADFSVVKTNETVSNTTPTSSSPAEPPTTQPPPTTPPTTSADPSQTGFTLPTPAGAAVDLWDSGYPTGQYYWTVVPVNVIASTSGGVTYRDAELPQEACQSGRILSFAKESLPTTTTEAAPYASGLSPDGHLASAAIVKPTFYGSPLVSWRPAVGAVAYEVQWSKVSYPWKTEGKPAFTFGTSALLGDATGTPLAPGPWYYRVRGLDPYVAGPAKQMTWSDPVLVTVATPRYRVVGQTSPVTKPAARARGTHSWREPSFSVKLPAYWRGVDHASVPSELRLHPELASYANATLLSELRRGGAVPTRFLAYDATEPSNGMFVRVLALPQHTHAQWAKTMIASLKLTSGYAGDLRCANAALPAGRALHCSLVLRGSGFRVRNAVYLFDRGKLTYDLTYASDVTRVTVEAPLFASSIRSFRIK